MAYNEKLADRIREALADLTDVVEKKMFRGVTFMVNGKMCISVSHDAIMCRFDPVEHEAIMEKDHTREMIKGDKALKGFVYVDEEGTKTKRQLDYWIDKCLKFNKDAKASKKSKKQ
jgi:TfoX/Sxy family transcriptional regulator of competence genes